MGYCVRSRGDTCQRLQSGPHGPTPGSPRPSLSFKIILNVLPTFKMSEEVVQDEKVLEPDGGGAYTTV